MMRFPRRRYRARRRPRRDPRSVNANLHVRLLALIGVVALMWSANPALIGDIDRTEQILVETAREASVWGDAAPVCGDPTARPNNVTGYGIVDAYAAVEMALAEQ